MKATRTVTLAALFLAALCPGVSISLGSEPTREQIDFFETKIRPVLAQRCYQCHTGAAGAKGGLHVDSREGLLQGGESGPAVVPGKPEESQLLLAIRGDTFEMPPNEKLSAAVIDDFTKWIKMGAPDPRKAEALTASPTIKIDPKVVREHWAFQAPKKHLPPQVVQTSWPINDVDRFILAGLERRQMAPADDADRSVWLRRVYLDLIGLLPTPEQQEAFVHDSRPDAYARVVDSLLSSPRFGERWGRHWLDAVRFGESTGKERNVPYSQAWRYRNWVIDSINDDKPYDRFLTEQLAGDLLPARDDGERKQLLTATGFLAVGVKSVDQVKIVSALEIADEQIDVVGRAMIGISLACARCHDHKFEPVPTRDYYALAGIFTNTIVHDGIAHRPRITSQLNNLLVAPPGNDQLSKKLEELAKLDEQWQESNREYHKVRHKDKDAERLRRRIRRALEEQLDELATEIVQLGRDDLLIAVADAETPTDQAIRIRGEPFISGPVVPRGMPTFLEGVPSPSIPATSSGRLELAQWITQRSNPLTARVHVNRVWSYLFGAGLVDTHDDFGLQSSQPTHPELLDTLAVQFVDEGWSLKKLIRQLVLSRTYRQSSLVNNSHYAEIDAENRLLWKAPAKRLEGEILRDVMLQASGQLDFNRPQQSQVFVAGAKTFEEGIDFEPLCKASRTRSVYLPLPRSYVPEALRIFDQADPSLVVTKRNTTSTPPQALFLMNSPLVIEHAAALAKRLLRDRQDDASRIELAYRLVLGRAPRPDEQKLLRAYLAEWKSSNSLESHWTTLVQTLFALPEFRHTL